MEVNPLWTVYNNVITMLTEYRGYTLQSPRIQTAEALINHVSNNDYVVVRAGYTRDGRPGSTNAVIIHPSSTSITKVPKFQKLFNLAILAETPVTNLILITEHPFNTHVAKALAALITEYPGVYIEEARFRIFSIVLPRHELSYEHYIVTPREIEKYLTDTHRSVTDLQRILSGDSAVIWIGARVGDVVGIIRLSETSGTAIGYRLCVRGTQHIAPDTGL